jgi:RND superfamily putative drug exporter
VRSTPPARRRSLLVPSEALSDDLIIKSIGLSLAFGILADAFLVLLTLVPAVMALLGRRAWWMPKRVDRIVPNLDIEGENLTEGLAKADHPRHRR